LPLYTQPVTIPANTPKDKPVEVVFMVKEEYVTGINVFFPNGCTALARVAAFYGEEQLAPKPAGSYFSGDGMLVKSPMRWRIQEYPCPITFKCWNIDETYEQLK